MSESFTLTLELLRDYEFKTTFDGMQVEPILLDEPPPLGSGAGPNASRMLGAAVGNCLSASLLFCLRKSKVPVEGIRTQVTGETVRNERGRLRIGALKVELHLDADMEHRQRIERCLSLFEDYCVVTASVRKGISVTVRVLDSNGEVLLEDSGEAS